GALSQKRQPKVAYREDAISEYDYKKTENLGPEEPITEEYESEGPEALKAFQTPPQSRRDTYKWPFPVTIYVFYKSFSELPRNLELLRANPDYQVHYYGIYEEDKYLNFYLGHYKDHIETPVIVVNGQVYLGPIEDNNEILHFVEEVQSTYEDIYIYCNCNDCISTCDSELFRKAIGNLVLSKGEQYPLRMFKVHSPGAILSLCPPGSIYALYGESRQDEHKLSEHIRYRARDYADKELQSFKGIPVTTIELYLKKDNDLSNELLNVISCASYYSGGKLRFTITEWNKDIPSININGNEIPEHYYPTSYYTLLTMIKKYSKI
ncbi:MAG: hypothetical protein JW825_01190, partial [Candidatus Methanofastidiosa archaeon]|nr:hypothetical protein [Candidatus Methanofastidiosa archaeon]